MLMSVIAHGVCTDTVRESAVGGVSGDKNPLPLRGIEPWLFQSDALETELSWQV